MEAKMEISKIIDDKAALFTNAADQIWDYAEVRFALNKSADLLCNPAGRRGVLRDARPCQYG